MNSTLNRVQNVFGYFTTVAFVVASAIAVSVVLSAQEPSASLQLQNIQVVKGRPHYYSTKREEYAHIRFDLETDLSSLFNWNTKQVFLYITASYPSADPARIPPSEAIVWDAIVPAANAPFHPNTYIHPGPDGKKPSAPPRKKSKASASKGKTAAAPPQAWPAGAKPGIVRLNAQKPKYQITDISGKMAERGNATLELRWNVQPWVGALTWTTWASGFGRWKGLEGGRAKFEFPPLKGTEVKKEDLRTETGAERNRGSPA